MRRIVFVLPLLLAACNEAKREDAVGPAGPDVTVSSVPGVAVNYRYGFLLPVARIAATQEDHAAQCEALGPAICRVAGMTYHVERNRSVSASLELRLAPGAARHFGKAAIDAVGRHGGMLADAKIDSEEAGATQSAANADTASRETERAQIEQQLARPDLRSAERMTLQERLAVIAEANRQSAGVARDAAFKLAQTPMTLDYQSGDVDLSLADGPIIGAMKDGWDNIVSAFAVILLMIITLLPWAGVVAVIAWGWHRVNRWMKRTPPADAGGAD